jgi:hypothetical protein
MARFSAPLSTVGGTLTFAVPAKVTSATLKRSGRLAMNFFADSFAASSRLGVTSLASMDQDTSIVTTMVARSLGWRP